MVSWPKPVMANEPARIPRVELYGLSQRRVNLSCIWSPSIGEVDCPERNFFCEHMPAWLRRRRQCCRSRKKFRSESSPSAWPTRRWSTWAWAGVAASRPSAPSSSAATGSRRERRARPPSGSGRARSRGGACRGDGERDGVEAAGRCAPASRRTHFTALGARRSALGARRSALGARRSALGARRSALGARRSALGARRSALGARRSALGARRLIIPPTSRAVMRRLVMLAPSPRTDTPNGVRTRWRHDPARRAGPPRRLPHIYTFLSKM